MPLYLSSPAPHAGGQSDTVHHSGPSVSVSANHSIPQCAEGRSYREGGGGVHEARTSLRAAKDTGMRTVNSVFNEL